MAENTTHLIAQQKHIERMLSVIDETNAIANETMIELPRQGESIRRQINQTIQIGDTVQHARTIVGRMTRRRIIESVALVGVILVLLFIACLVLFFVARSYYLQWNNQ